MTHQAHTTEGSLDGPDLGVLLDEVAWAVLLIMTGALWLAPAGWAPDGSWLIGLGLILLGHNGARRLYRLRASGLGIAAGIAALLAGVGRIPGGPGLVIPIVLVALGTLLAVSTARHADTPGGPCR